ncbi:MAG: ChbG/HpnK family deacetylase [Sandaracinaceae bacterium]|nr:ChbG/HpnK family deacetylase [Sandaracinaceae bacterium]
MTRTLVITADDLGIDPRRDDGIVVAFARGAITQSSLMVRGQSAPSAARAANRIGLPLGLHLDLTESPPSAPAASIPTLLDASGHKRGKHGLRAAIASGAIDPADVVRETRAQLAAFEAMVGRPARHVDGHQHVQSIPFLAELLAPVFAEAGVRTTRIAEQREVHVEDPSAARFYQSVADDARASRPLYAAHGIDATESFIGLDLMGFACEPSRLLRALEHASGPRVELMCHPGFVGEGVDDFNQSPAREHELRVLNGLPFEALIARGELVLTSLA